MARGGIFGGVDESSDLSKGKNLARFNGLKSPATAGFARRMRRQAHARFCPSSVRCALSFAPDVSCHDEIR